MNICCLDNGIDASPCEAVIMSQAILFWGTAFLIRDVSVFIKDRLCQLSFEAGWVNLVRTSMCAITSSRPMNVSVENKLLSQVRSLETAVSVGMVGRRYIPRTEEGVRSLL